MDHDMQDRARALLDFLLIVGKCKTEKRTGWVNERVPLPESVADHMFRMAVMALTCGEMHGAEHEGSMCTCGASSSSPSSQPSPSTHIDPLRATLMALIHDLAESLVGDITPTAYSGITKTEKSRREAAAMEQIVALLSKARNETTTTDSATSTTPPTLALSSSSSSSSSSVASLLHSLWQEYESGSTPTAKFVKSLDKIEMYIQALEYQTTSLTVSTAAAEDTAAAVAAAATQVPSVSPPVLVEAMDVEDEKTQIQPPASSASPSSSPSSSSDQPLYVRLQRFYASASSVRDNVEAMNQPLLAALIDQIRHRQEMLTQNAAKASNDGDESS